LNTAIFNKHGTPDYRRDVVDVLENLGVEVVRVDEKSRDPWAMCLCPFHDDHSPSFAVSVDTGHWVCYAGCGAGRLETLVARVRGISEADALRWLQNMVAPDPGNNALVQALQPAAAQPDVPAVVPPYEHGKTYRYMIDRGFTPETLKAWDVGQDRTRGAVVLPISFRGEVAGLIYRHVNPLVTPKYVYTPGLQASEVLFGWDMLPDVPAEVVAVEGPLDAVWLWQAGIPAVALLGAQISRPQAALLSGRTRNVVLALDRDEAGLRGTGQALRLLGRRCRVRIAILPEGRKDVQECNAIELRVVIDEAVDAASGGL
jgi:DNA primase